MCDFTHPAVPAVWIAKKKILEAMELRLDEAIDKTENLARDVEIDRTKKNFDSLIEKAHEEKVVAMVAEPDSQYGADTFEAYEKEKGGTVTVSEIKYSDLKKDGKFR